MPVDALGAVDCWGYDGYGVVSGTPLSGTYTEVVTGYTFACALEANGSISCWGQDPLSQGAFVRPNASTDNVAARGQQYSVCALSSSGSVTCSGLQQAQELDGAPRTDGFTEIWAERSLYCVTNSAGDLHCWGDGIHDAGLTILGGVSLSGPTAFEMGSPSGAV